MEEIKLSAEKRDGGSTRKQLSTLRGAAKIPGVIYGGGKEPVEVAVPEKDLIAARRKGGVNAILSVEVGGKTETVIVKALQRHPVTDRLTHADFQRISLTQKISARVPIHIVGEAPGVKTGGGTLQHQLRELNVRALPTKIPQAIDLDISRLELNDHISVKDVKVPEGVELLDPADQMVVHVTLAKEEVVEAPAAAAAPVEGAAAEPESSNTKGKKDEEGKLVKETAKAAAPAAGEKGKEPAKKEGK
jgi:large subunit ribosomal protein L25